MVTIRLLIAGDTHGNLRQWKYLFEVAQIHEADCIVQLGDFGYWEHTQQGAHTLDQLAALVAKNKPVYWIDGNHENHTLLRSKYDCQNGPVEIRPNLTYMPRGTRWSWNDVSFLAAGGAYSVDKEWRKPGKSWWPEEMITDEEVEKCIKHGKVDIILSHDVPNQVDIQAQFVLAGSDFWKADHESERNRKQLSKIVDATSPKYLFHGHYHIRYSDTIFLGELRSVCKIEGLACDDMGNKSWTIVDL